MNIASFFTRAPRARALAPLAALALAGPAAPALADDCGVWGWGGGISFGYTTGWNDGCFSVGVSYPSLVYASGPRHYYNGGYYRGYGGWGGYYDDCRPSYRQYYRPRNYHYYYDYSPRYYQRPTYRRYYRSYDDCGYYSWGGEALDGGYASGSHAVASVNTRGPEYAGDPNFVPGGFKVVSAAPTTPDQFDPDWAGDAVAMLRKGQADDAILALEAAALQPAMFPIQPATSPTTVIPATSEPVSDLTLGTPSSQPAQTSLTTLGQAGTPAEAPAAVQTANPEALRILGMALIWDGRMDEGAQRIAEAYRADIALVNSPVDERMFPSDARFTIRDLIRKLSVRANQTNAPEAWFALGVLMQAEGRDSVALDMVIKASGAGLSQDLVSPMADALRRVVYGRG